MKIIITFILALFTLMHIAYAESPSMANETSFDSCERADSSEWATPQGSYGGRWGEYEKGSDAYSISNKACKAVFNGLTLGGSYIEINLSTLITNKSEFRVYNISGFDAGAFQVFINFSNNATGTCYALRAFDQGGSPPNDGFRDSGGLITKFGSAQPTYPINLSFKFFFGIGLTNAVNVSLNGTTSTYARNLSTSCLNISRIRMLNKINQAGATMISGKMTVVGCNGSSADTAPVEIVYFNLTNGSGCENWNTDKTNACKTTSLTPTVQLNTSEDAFCAIAGGISMSTLDVNYTDMGSSRNCTGDGAGEGTRFHRCTLTLQDELFYDSSYLFISCKEAGPNQNQKNTSTSGALAINITDLEATGKNSIGAGIQNSLVSGYTDYTNQKVYARNSADAQTVGTFDRVAKKLSKIWAFNRIGVSDSYVNMFNITPVLYTLEFANKTSVYIENQTALLINSTK